MNERTKKEKKTRLIGKLVWTCWWFFFKSVYYDICQHLYTAFKLRVLQCFSPSRTLSCILSKINRLHDSSSSKSWPIKIKYDEKKIKYNRNRIYWSRDRCHVHQHFSYFLSVYLLFRRIFRHLFQLICSCLINVNSLIMKIKSLLLNDNSHGTPSINRRDNIDRIERWIE